MRTNILTVVPLILALAEPVSLPSQTLFSWYNLHVHADSVHVTMLASGRVQGTDNVNANQRAHANGSAGLSMQMSKLTVAGFVNVTSTIDTVRGDFGPALLTPASGGKLRAGVLEVRFPDFYRHYGVRAYATASHAVWEDTTRRHPDTISAFPASIIGAGVTLFRQWQAFSPAVSPGEVASPPDTQGTTQPAAAPGQGQYNRVAFALEAGITWRRLSGDIATQDEFRRRLLGTEGRNFLGLEGGMTLTIGDIAASIQIYRTWSLAGGTFRGLTGTQVDAALTLQGPLFSFGSKLN